MTVHKTVAQLGIAVAAEVVNRINAIFKLEDSNVVALGRDSYACAFKQVGLGGHIGPVAHVQIG